MPIEPLRRAAEDTDSRILPLINVVFLLLIFFMIAGTLTARAPFELVLPEAQNAAAPTEDAQTLWIAADGRIALGQDVIPPDMLRIRLSDAPPMAMRLEADAAAPADLLVATVAVLNAAGVETVDIVTLAGERAAGESAAVRGGP